MYLGDMLKAIEFFNLPYDILRDLNDFQCR